jgi:hypothetical protein
VGSPKVPSWKYNLVLNPGYGTRIALFKEATGSWVFVPGLTGERYNKANLQCFAGSSSRHLQEP